VSAPWRRQHPGARRVRQGAIGGVVRAWPGDTSRPRSRAVARYLAHPGRFVTGAPV